MCRRGRGCLLGTGILGRTSILLLQIGQTTSLSMDILDLLGGLSVKVDKLLASWGLSSLLVVRGQSGKERVNTGSDAIAVVNGLGLVGSMVLGIKLVESLEEAVAYTMLLVKFDSTLDSLVANNISMSKVFGNDTASGLLLLGDLVTVTLGLVLVVVAIVLVATSGTGDLNLSGTKLGIVKEEGSLGSGFLLEGYGRILGGLSFGDLEAGNLATEREEVSNLLLAGLRTDVLNVNGIGRHDV